MFEITKRYENIERFLADSVFFKNIYNLGLITYSFRKTDLAATLFERGTVVESCLGRANNMWQIVYLSEFSGRYKILALNMLNNPAELKLVD